MVEVEIEFTEECPDGGWHIESGINAPAKDVRESVYQAPCRHGVWGRCASPHVREALLCEHKIVLAEMEQLVAVLCESEDDLAR